MDVLQFIRQMQEIYGDELIKPASELPRPQQALDREMFENAFRDKKADGGQLVKPNTDGSRPEYGGPQPGSVKNRFREWVKTADKEFLKTASIGDIIKKSKIKINNRNALNVFAEDEFKKFKPTRDFDESARTDLKKLLKNKTGRMESVTYKGKEYFKSKDGRIREKTSLKVDRPEAYEQKIIKQQKKADLIKNKDVFPSVGKDVKLMIWRDLYDSTKKRTYGPRAGDYEVPDPRLKMVNKGKINLTTDFVKNKLVLLDTKTGKKITFKNLEKYIDKLPGTSYKDMTLPYQYKTWLTDQTINYKGKTKVPLRTILRENLLTENELSNWRASPYEVHHPFGKNEDPFKVQLVQRKANGLEGNIRLETLKELDKAGVTEKDVDKIINNFEKKINKIGGIQSGVRDKIVGEELSPDSFLKKITSEAKIGREARPLYKGLQVFMKANGIKCNLNTGRNCNSPLAYEKSLNELAAKAQAGDNAAQSKLVNFGKNVVKAGKVIKNVMGPYAVATEIALAIPSGAYGYAKGQPLSQIANTLTYGLAGESQTERLKKLDPNFGATQKLDAVADRFYNLERLQKGTGQQKVRSKPKFEKAERDLDVALLPFTTINPQIEAGRFLDPDAYTRRMEKDASLMAADQAAMKQRAIDRGMDTPENFGYGFARGGLSGGDTSGPPPEKGPMSQGLLSLYKNGRKL